MDTKVENKVEKDVCQVQHRALEHRMDRLEVEMTDLEASLAKNLERIFDKLDKFSNRPSWLVTSIIGFLGSGLSITMAILFKWGH